MPGLGVAILFQSIREPLKFFFLLLWEWYIMKSTQSMQYGLPSPFTPAVPLLPLANSF